MTLKERIIEELERSPDVLLEQFLNFLLFIKQRHQTTEKHKNEE